MARKEAEKFIPGLVRYLARAIQKQFYWKKYRDRTYCDECGHLQPKSEAMPDYVMGIGFFLYTEVKGPFKDGRWTFADSISPIQHAKLKELAGWIFIELGKGRRPKDRVAFFLSYEDWFDIETRLLGLGQKSLTLDGSARSESGRELLGAWEMQWSDGQWIPPEGHPIWEKIGKPR